jgi:hypothetical protein
VRVYILTFKEVAMCTLKDEQYEILDRNTSSCVAIPDTNTIDNLHNVCNTYKTHKMLSVEIVNSKIDHIRSNCAKLSNINAMQTKCYTGLMCRLNAMLGLI